MFGSAARTRRPILLTLVFGAFLVIVGITAAGLSTIVTTHVTAVALQTITSGDGLAISRLAGDELRAADLEPGSIVDPARRSELDAALVRLVSPDGLLRVEIHRADGTLVTADRPGPLGGAPPAFDLKPTAGILPLAEAGAAAGDLPSPWLLREQLPITDTSQRILAVATIWRDAAPILQRLDDVRNQVLVVTLSAAIVASGLLFLIFRSAQRRLTRQTIELVEATRTDALTGTLNHGALVTMLASLIEVARSDDPATDQLIGVALIDLDNFTLLNDNHGHKVGDLALTTVLEEIRATAPAGAIIGRYGPDEFLVIVPAEHIAALEPALEQVRSGLVQRGLEVDAADRLPITISAGIASYPHDATSLTVLLATVAATLGSAKASGGDDVRVAWEEKPEATGQSSFDVLQGLVFAVDTKDRYTKRHSDDVARYAAFLAGRIGLDEATIATIRTAGLLHDVGKIGIPDSVLRKPGRLTAEENKIVQQHVVLGDMIVRELPDIDEVRAGIRHHHERWDGGGYMDHLGAEDIPLIARILAVGDTFSAMTTTRPYRKALDIREAFRRLEDAAGTQLDEDLVLAFVQGMETAPDAPIPGDDRAVRLLVPRAVA